MIQPLENEIFKMWVSQEHQPDLKMGGLSIALLLFKWWSLYVILHECLQTASLLFCITSLLYFINFPDDGERLSWKVE